MKKLKGNGCCIIFCTVIYFIFAPANLSAQTLSPTVIPSCGGYASIAGASFSWSLGQTYDTTLQTGVILLTEGFQQPELNILTGSVASSYCAGTTVTVSYTAAGYYGASNVFTAQLSNASGSFALPTTIGTLVSNASGTISCTIPSNTPGGTGYRIRVVSSNPAVTGSDNGSNITISASSSSSTSATACNSYAWNSSTYTSSGIYTYNVGATGYSCDSVATLHLTINPLQTATASSNSPVTQGSTLNLTSSGGNTYLWTSPNGFTSSSQNPVISNAALANTGTYTVTAKNASGCTATATTIVIVNSSSSAGQSALWSMTWDGGTANGNGAIFKINLDGTGYSTPYNFNVDTNGINPAGSLILASNGKLYGMTNYGGSNFWAGVLFSFDPVTNIYTKLQNLNACYECAGPTGSLIQATNGKLYGMTAYGGTNNEGNIFSFDPSTNTYSDLVDFNGSNGGYPTGTLIQASNGKLYGVTEYNIFSFDPSSNTFSNLSSYSFSYGSLMQATNGLLYGTASGNFGSDKGNIFSFNLSTNSINDLLNFNGTNGESPQNNDLVQATNGLLYGMVREGGANENGNTNGDGVLFNFNSSTNTYDTLLSFNGTNGENPGGSLIQASNGKLYGMTGNGGAHSDGVLFNFDPTSNTYTKLRDLNSPDGTSPEFSSFIEVPLIVTTSSIPSPLCAGNSVAVTFTVGGGTYNSGNSFTVQLSNSSGSFASPVNIGTLASVTSGTINVTIPSNTPAGTGYRIRVVSNNPVITGTDNGSNITISAGQAVTISASNNSPLCSGSILNLFSSSVDTIYTWTGPNGFTSSQQNPNITNIAPADSGTYIVNVTDVNQCIASASTKVTLNPLTTATVSGGGTVCAGTTLPNVSIALTGTSPWTLTYAIGGVNQTPLTGITTSPYVITGAAAGTYSVTALSDAICTGTSFTGNATVTVNPLPTPTTSSNSPICSGSTLNLSSGGGASYSWMGPNGFTSTQQNPTIANAVITAAGTYTVIVTGANGCSATATVSASVLPVATISSNSPVCSGNTLNLSSGGGTSYSWTGPNSFTSIQQNPVITNVSSSNAGTYIVTVTNAGGCSATPSIFVSVNTLPSINSVNSQSLCTGTATSGINFSGTGNIYNWTNSATSIGLAASGTGNITSFTALNSGISQVTATITATPVSSGFAYITDPGDEFVYVINRASGSVIDTIRVTNGVGSISVSPNGSRVYVGYSRFSNVVSVINTSTNTISNSITVGGGPNGISVSPDGSKVYVANFNPGPFSGSVSVINTTTNTVTATITVGRAPQGITVSPDGSRVYVANNGSNTISVINASSNTVIATDTVGSEPNGISVSPDGSKVYVANYGSNTVSIINTATNIVTGTITVGSDPYGLSITPDGSKVYVTNNGSNTVSVINTTTNSITATITVGSAPTGISIGPDGSTLYVISNPVSVINTVTNTVTGTISVRGPASFGNFVTGTNCSGTPVTFSITVNPNSSSATLATTCNSYSWNGSTFTSSGSYIYHTSNPTGCDSAATLNLLVNYSSASNNSATACNSYSWNGSTYTTSGTYTYDAGANSVGCDSVATLNLIIDAIPTATASSNSPLCSGSTLNITSSGGTIYSWAGPNSFISSLQNPFITNATTAVTGTYTVTVTGSNGCSAIASTSVIVNQTPTINSVGNQTLYNGSSTAAINFSGTANAYNWANNNTSIGLAASGIGNIASFAATNNGASPVIATITATPVSGLAYIANNGSNTVSVINTATNTITTTINVVGHQPMVAVVSPDGSKVYVLVNNFGYGTGVVYVLNTSTNAVTANITVGSDPWSMSVSPDGSKLYVTNSNSNTVSVINTTNNTVIATVAVGTTPTGVSVSPNGNLVYIVNFSSSTVSVINTVTNTVTATINVGTAPEGITISPDGSKVYVTSVGFSNIVSVINTATNTVTATITVGNTPRGIVVNPSGSLLYVANQEGNTVSVINTTTDSVTTTIAVGTGPFGISISPDGSRVYVTNYTDGTVSVINTAINTIVSTISVGSDPFSLGNFVTGSSCSGTPATFTITVNPNSASSASVTACNSYTWNGTTYTASDNYIYHTTNAAGYDSAATLNLTINYSSTSTVSATACNSYIWNGSYYSSSGTYIDSSDIIGYNVNGCDSVATLILTIVSNSSSSTSVTVCESYTWNGSTYSTSGNYVYHTFNAAGCDSAITLYLTVNTTMPIPASSGSAWSNVGSAGFSAGNITGSANTPIAIDGSGTPYVVYGNEANNGKATVMKYNGSSWVTVGNAGFSSGVANYTCIAIDPTGIPYVVYQDGGNSNKATVMKYNGSSWATVGNAGFSAGEAGNTAIAIDGGGTPYVVYSDSVNNYHATVMKFNGSSWIAVGSAGFSAGAASWTSIAINSIGIPYVVYQDGGNRDKATVMKYDGGSWVTVGSAGFSVGVGVAFFTTIAIDGSGTPYVAYSNYSNSGPATVMKYNGSSWVTVGSGGISAGVVEWTSIAIDGSGTPYVAYEDYANSLKATVMKYNGSGWVTVGSAGFTAGYANFTSLAISGSGTPYVFYQDGGYPDPCSVMSFESGLSSITGNTSVCASSTQTYSVAAASGATSYTWTLPSGWTGSSNADSINVTIGTVGGTVSVTANNSCGSASAQTLSVTIHSASTSSQSTTSCNSYVWNGSYYSSSGTYIDSSDIIGYNVNGCDSVATLILTIVSNSSSSTSVTVCDSYTWNGSTYSTSGSYIYHTTNSIGCDSTATLNLTITGPCTATVNLTMYIEGYYLGGGMMQQVLYNQGADPNPSSTAVDTVTVTLVDPTLLANDPDDNYMDEDTVATATGVLQTNGSLIVTFPGFTEGHNYWLYVTNRTVLQTWWNSIITVTNGASFNFNQSPDPSNGRNQIDVYDEGIYSMYSGDINQDQAVDISDLGELQYDVILFAYGYYNVDGNPYEGSVYSTDLNGDGAIDISDLGILQNNVIDFIYSIHP